MKKRGKLFGSNVEKIRGLKIVLPVGVNPKARAKAKLLAEKELELTRKPKEPQMHKIEASIAKYIGKRTFETKGKFKQDVYILRSEGKRVIIEHKGNARATPKPVTNIEEFTRVLLKVAREMKI